MKAVVLASGSEGNSTFFSSGNVKILIDIGKNAKYIKEKILEIQEEPTNIDAILISHTHDDHVSALKVFLKKFHPKVYVTEKMFYDLDFLKDYENVVIYDDDFYIDSIRVQTIRTSHDVTDSRNFILSDGENSLVYLTDTGYLNRKYFPVLKDKNYYLEGIKIFLKQDETVENFEADYEEYQEAYKKRKTIIDNLYDEIKKIKHLKL